MGNPPATSATPRGGGWLGEVLPLRAADLAAAAALALAYWATAAISLVFMTAPTVGVAFWPAAGVALAGVILGGSRLWPGVLVGHLLAGATILARAPAPPDLIVAVGATLAAGVPAAIFRRLRLDPKLSTLNDMLGLLLAGGALGATISAAAGAPVVVSGPGVDRLAVSWWFGHLAGVLALAPPILAWRPGTGPTLSWPSGLHLLLSVGAGMFVAAAIFIWSPPQMLRSWYVFPALVWPALAFSVRGASLALAAMAMIVFAATIAGLGPFQAVADPREQVLLGQQFVAVVAATVLILAAVADERRGRAQLRASAERLRDETEALEVLNRTCAAIAAELDLDAAVQLVTDAGRSLSGAQFGAFFYNVTDEAGQSYWLYALSGAPRNGFERLGQPRKTAVFAPTFDGEGVVRSGDITKDPRYGQNAPYGGMPVGHLSVRSYLAAPVRSRSGEVIGGLFFGHEDADVFTDRSERLVSGVASQAAIAIDNARLYQAAQREIAERRRAEEHQRLLMNELNHRVKNTLATVQSMGAQTLRSGRNLGEAREAFVSRLMALSTAHNLLTAESWESADLEDVVRMAVAAFDEPPGTRFRVSGPGVRLKAPHALGLAMALHELGANAQRYGALSGDGGRVEIGWTLEPSGLVVFVWEEGGGPKVSPPLRRGFGSRLIQEGLARELSGEVDMVWRPEGLRCELRFHVDRAPALEFDDFDDPGEA